MDPAMPDDHAKEAAPQSPVSMAIDATQTLILADLAKLHVSDAAATASELSALLTKFGEITGDRLEAELNARLRGTLGDDVRLDELPPLLGSPWAVETHPPALRADDPAEPLTQPEVLANAPDKAGGEFLVPRVVDG